jgi:hypothetical protein
MARSFKAVCPYCGADVISPEKARGIVTLQCPQCVSSFKVKGSETQAEPEPAPAPSSSPAPSEISMPRLIVVLCSAVLYLAGGAVLTGYCLHRNARSSDALRSLAETPPPEPPSLPSPGARSTVAVSMEEQRRIDDAIVKGVWYLKDHVPLNGTWGDGIAGVRDDGQSLAFAALPALTLLECGVPESDPIVQKAARFVREKAPIMRTGTDTYQRSLAILFLDRLGDPQDRELIQYLALGLIAGQRPDDHGWGYGCPLLDRQATTKLLTLLRDEKQTLEQWQQDALKIVAFSPGETDNSNSQFAILALWVSRRHGVPIERTIERVEKRFSTTQVVSKDDGMDVDGSWPYKANQHHVSEWPTMTCAGLLGMAVAQGLAAERKDKDRALEERSSRIRRGLAVLGRSIDRPEEKRKMDLYFLWSLERVGVLFNLDKIEGKDWYAWGRKPLLDSQQDDGSWTKGGFWGSHPVINTCFALLFLEQANLAADLTAKLRMLAEK